ncbi:MAG: hypothetical protein KAJ07_12455 [Planctomycetes bacterium]|nr:hypothetical protein [Planctomycetota bacterium]
MKYLHVCRVVVVSMFFMIWFTAPLEGKWKFKTTSKIQALGNRKGTATIENNPGGRGFVTSSGSKWAFSGTGEVFVPQLVMYKTPDLYYNDPERIDRDIQTFIVEHGFSGFHTFVFCRWFDIQQERVTDLSSKDPDPDLRTFEALELLIDKTYAGGGAGIFFKMAWARDRGQYMKPDQWSRDIKQFVKKIDLYD